MREKVAPYGWNLIAAALAASAFALARLQTPAFAPALAFAAVMFLVGAFSVYVGDKAAVAEDLTTKTVLIVLIGLELTTVSDPVLLQNPYAPVKTIKSVLLASLLFLGVLVLDGVVREWDRDNDDNFKKGL